MKKINKILLISVILLFFCTLSVVGQDNLIVINNPYEGVDWVNWEQHKANLHTHTTESDGNTGPAGVIDRYYDLGYTILSLTDHDTYQTEPIKHPGQAGPLQTTWPWQKFDRDPDELGMVAIEGNEISRTHHLGSFFNDYGGGTNSEQTALVEIAERNGLAMFYHPGRYDRSLEWYLEYYREHDHLIGLEVYNQGDKYPDDRELWDQILNTLMPERPVWGFSNDDMHRVENHLGRNFNIFVLEELNDENVRKAMVNGNLYFVYTPRVGDPFPKIEEVIVNDNGISLKVDEYKEITWISSNSAVEAEKNYNSFLEIAAKAIDEANNKAGELKQRYIPFTEDSYRDLVQGRWSEIGHKNIEDAIYDFSYRMALFALTGDVSKEQFDKDEIVSSLRTTDLWNEFPVDVASLVVGRGDLISIEEVKGYSYVRARIKGDTGITYTQPFGIENDSEILASETPEDITIKESVIEESIMDIATAFQFGHWSWEGWGHLHEDPYGNRYEFEIDWEGGPNNEEIMIIPANFPEDRDFSWSAIRNENILISDWSNYQKVKVDVMLNDDVDEEIAAQIAIHVQDHDWVRSSYDPLIANEWVTLSYRLYDSRDWAENLTNDNLSTVSGVRFYIRSNSGDSIGEVSVSLTNYRIVK
ncbi:PHP domain-containing protein [Natronospora cellulosivora (SeqCode)]